MPPKIKSPKVKPDWVLCPQSGLLYHSTDSSTHAAWLSSCTISPTPSHTHIVSDRLNSTINLVSPSSLSLSLPPQVLYSSIFLRQVPPSTLIHLQVTTGPSPTRRVSRADPTR